MLDDAIPLTVFTSSSKWWFLVSSQLYTEGTLFHRTIPHTTVCKL